MAVKMLVLGGRRWHIYYVMAVEELYGRDTGGMQLMAASMGKMVGTPASEVVGYGITIVRNVQVQYGDTDGSLYMTRSWNYMIIMAAAEWRIHAYYGS